MRALAKATAGALLALLAAGVPAAVAQSDGAPISIRPPEEPQTVPSDDAAPDTDRFETEIANPPAGAPPLRTSLSDSEPMDIGIEPETLPAPEEGEVPADGEALPGDETVGEGALPSDTAGEGSDTMPALENLAIEGSRPRGEGGELAVFRGLDKVFARVTVFSAPVGQPVNFGRLEVKVNYCDKRPPTETPEVAAFVEVNDLRAAEKANEGGDGRIFTGWMFASSPALNAIEHPVYDVWLIDCKAAEPDSDFGSLSKEPSPKAVDRKTTR